jgi:hypothetical protein
MTEERRKGVRVVRGDGEEPPKSHPQPAPRCQRAGKKAGQGKSWLLKTTIAVQEDI